MTHLPTACIIGAGSSGIAGAKVLQERGVPFDVYEKSDRVGGNWVFGNRNGMSSSYRTLHINTSRERMEYSDYPMPKSFPDFPHHTHIARYFNDYVDRFGVRDKIRFETGVERADRGDDGLWEVALEGASDGLAASQGIDPNQWRADATAERIKFLPSLIPQTMRWTNRPVFQQAIEFGSHR